MTISINIDLNMKKFLTIATKTQKQLQRKIMISNIQVAGKIVNDAQEQIKPRNSILVSNEPFRNDTGKAKRSTKYQLNTEQIKIIGNTDYYSFLEEGTRKMSPYPTIKIAVQKNLPYLMRLTEETMRKFFVKYE